MESQGQRSLTMTFGSCCCRRLVYCTRKVRSQAAIATLAMFSFVVSWIALGLSNRGLDDPGYYPAMEHPRTTTTPLMIIMMMTTTMTYHQHGWAIMAKGHFIQFHQQTRPGRIMILLEGGLVLLFFAAVAVAADDADILGVFSYFD
jgi:hypothetical protein